MTDQPIAPDLPQARGPRVAKALIWIGMIWLIGWIGMILTHMLKWSDPWAGAASGALQGAFLSPFLLIVTLPAGLVGWWIATWRPLRKWRLAVSLLFAAAIPLLDVVSAASNRLQPGRRFTRLTGVAFPPEAKISEWDFQGGGFADLNYTYVFTCSPEETERLIRELKLSKSDTGESFLGWSTGVGATVGGGGWTITEVWNHTGGATGEAKVGAADYVELHTDATRTKVRLIVGTI